MTLQIGVLCIVLNFVTKVQSISEEGPSHLRYDPCGLGNVYFDKISNANSTRWMGYLNLYLSPEMNEIELETQFRDLVGISLETVVQQEAHVTIGSNNSTIVTLKYRGQLSKKYVIFYVDVPSGDVPFVTELKLNDQILCSESIRASQAKQIIESNSGEQVCGSRTLSHAELVTTNEEVKRGEWPWHVAVLGVSESNYMCGGSIISNTAVLTACYCVWDNERPMEPTSVMVLAGTNDVKNRTANGVQLLYAEQIISHPSYKSTSASAYLAIIKVSGMRFTEYVQPICLWGQSFNKSHLFGTHAMFVGFEKPNYKTLRLVNLLIQSDETCKKEYSSSFVAWNMINEFTFCAAYGKDGGTNLHLSTGGSGLVTAVLHPDNRTSWYLTGVFSLCTLTSSKESCDLNFSTIYSLVSAHFNWIQYHSQGVKTDGSFDKYVDTTEMAEIN